MFSQSSCMSVPMNATKSLVFMRSRCIERNVADINILFYATLFKKGPFAHL